MYNIPGILSNPNTSNYSLVAYYKYLIYKLQIIKINYNLDSVLNTHYILCMEGIRMETNENTIQCFGFIHQGTGSRLRYGFIDLSDLCEGYSLPHLICSVFHPGCEVS